MRGGPDAVRLWAVAVLGVLVALLVVGIVGVSPAGDTPRYLDAAEQLLAGELPRSKAASYPGYSAVVALMLALGAGTGGVVVLQALAHGAAVLAAGDLGRRLHSPTAGLAAGGLVALNLDVHIWHTYVLPDSLYTTALVVSAGLLVRAACTSSRWWVAVAAVGLLAPLSLRPNAVLWVPAGALWLAWMRTRRGAGRRVLAPTAMVVVVGLAVVVPVAARGAAAEQPGRMLEWGVVAAGPPVMDLPMPAADEPVETVGDVAAYVADHPVATMRLVVARVGIQLAHVRSYYPPTVNGARFLAAVGLYVLAVMGLARVGRRPVTALVGLAVVAHLAVVAATFADHEGRFLVHLVPLISVLSGVGLTEVGARLGLVGRPRSGQSRSRSTA